MAHAGPRPVRAAFGRIEYMPEAIVEMRDITKCFRGVTALSHARLELRKSEVLGLVGENGAGKSTLMNILSALLQPDGGEIMLKGRPVKFKSPHNALLAGIAMIHQEICLVPDLSVAENVWIGREKKFTHCGIVDMKEMQDKTREILDKFGIEIPSGKAVRSLSIAGMQLVEIARALSYNADVLIMDEPTSTLTDRETKLLFDIIGKLKAEGVSVIFISHKLEEIMGICDRITIMRDSQYIDTVLPENITTDELISLMVGRKLDKLYQKAPAEIGAPVLEVQHLTRKGYFNDISFKVRRGEIVGMAGLVGAGRSEIARAVFGVDRYDSGKILVNGEEVRIHKPIDAIEAGLAMVTEDRAALGLVLGLSSEKNITMASQKDFCKFGFMEPKKEAEACVRYVNDLSIKMSSRKQLAAQLSGGNQQKVVLAKWLMTKPRVLILDEPTRGIDVGSKAEIYGLMSRLAQQGLAILMISSELPEILGMSDRILVMSGGDLVHSCPREGATQDGIMKYAFGKAKQRGVPV